MSRRGGGRARCTLRSLVRHGWIVLALPTLLHAAVEPELDALRLKGQRQLEEFDYGAALTAFDAIVHAFEAGRLDPWEPEQLAILAEAFEGRAVAHLGVGDIDAVRADFEAALDAHPGFAPDRERNSPRLMEIFDELRARRIGWLTVRTEPPGGVVSIEGHRIGDTPLDEIPWYAGEVRMRIDHPGHDPWIAVVDLPPGGTKLVQQRLVPNARTVILRTSPPGASVQVDGVLVATSEGPAEPAEAARLGMRKEDLSREVFLRYLAPGRHQLRLELPCHLPRELAVDVEVNASDNRPLLLEPQVLERAIARLEVTSHPSGAMVSIDGADVGRTPLVLPEACAGMRRIEARGEQRGLWSGEMELARDRERKLDVVLLPTLVFAGVRAEDAEAARAMQRIIVEDLVGLQGYNVLRLEGGTPPDSPEGLVHLLDELHADLGLAAELHPGRVHPAVELTLVSRHVAEPETAWGGGEGTSYITQFLDRLRRPTEVLQPWIGLVPVDSRLDDGPVVGRLFPDGPAHLAGVLVGDRITAAGGRPVRGIADLQAALAEASGEITMNVRRGVEEKHITIALGATPVLLAPGDPDRSYHKMLVDLEYLPDRDSRPQAAVAARLNRALALLHFGRCDLALSQPLGPPAIPVGPGIGAGTLAYLRGLCYEQLGPGYTDDALRAFDTAAASEETTWRTNDGPPLAPMARCHREALGS